MSPDERERITATLAVCPVCTHAARLGRDDPENLSDGWVLCSNCTLRSRIDDWPKKFTQAQINAAAKAICIACKENPDHVGDSRSNEFRWQDYTSIAEAGLKAATEADEYSDAACKLLQIKELATTNHETKEQFVVRVLAVLGS